MEPHNQDQHKIPQVYLKKFGYLNDNNQWKVSVLSRTENFSREKSIGSFTIAANVFDIDSDDPRIIRMFEKLNGELENEYNTIIAELQNAGTLSDNSYAYLLQLIGNLIVRSDYWRETISDLLNTDARETFLTVIIAHHTKRYDELMEFKKQDFFQVMLHSPVNDIINKALLFFLDHLMERLWHFEIVIIQSQDVKPWWTSTNPVVVHNRTAKFEFFGKDSEIYFPLSPTYLAYLHYPGSGDKGNQLRSLEHNTIHQANDEQNAELQHLILDNFAEFVIFAGRVNIARGDME
ncbi:DUF4238 domain-containing protein [Mucilaginibacter sp. McL0603]|uniref:DUF4238 domain-containing protein n=1 Tax=Mucilaginibacter sp. McL0603 TaxID=3415670 RepID=UPI003CED4A6C